MKGKSRHSFSEERKSRKISYQQTCLKEWLEKVSKKKEIIKEVALEHQEGKKNTVSKNIGFSKLF